MTWPRRPRPTGRPERAVSGTGPGNGTAGRAGPRDPPAGGDGDPSAGCRRPGVNVPRVGGPGDTPTWHVPGVAGGPGHHCGCPVPGGVVRGPITPQLSWGRGGQWGSVCVSPQPWLLTPPRGTGPPQAGTPQWGCVFGHVPKSPYPGPYVLTSTSPPPGGIILAGSPSWGSAHTP